MTLQEEYVTIKQKVLSSMYSDDGKRKLVTQRMIGEKFKLSDSSVSLALGGQRITEGTIERLYDFWDFCKKKKKQIKDRRAKRLQRLEVSAAA